MCKKYYLLINFSLITSLSGCASLDGWTSGHSSVPRLHENVSLNAVEVQKRVQCELTKASAKYAWLANRRYAARLEFQVTDDFGVDPSFGVIESIGSRGPGQNVNISNASVFNKQTFREGVINFGGRFSALTPTNDIKGAALEPENCPDQSFLIDDKNRRVGAILNGKIGIKEWLKDVDGIAKNLAKTPGQNLGDVVHTFRFTYVASGSINPIFTLLPINVNQLTPSLDLDIARERFYLLSISTARIAPDPEPTVVALSSEGVEAVQKSIETAIANASNKNLAFTGKGPNNRISAPKGQSLNTDRDEFIQQRSAEDRLRIENIESLDDEL